MGSSHLANHGLHLGGGACMSNYHIQYSHRFNQAFCYLFLFFFFLVSFPFFFFFFQSYAFIKVQRVHLAYCYCQQKHFPPHPRYDKPAFLKVFVTGNNYQDCPLLAILSK